MGSAVEGFTRRTPPVMGYRTERRLRRARLQEAGRRRALLSFTQAFSPQQKDLGVFHQPVGDGGGDGGVVEDVAPVGERGVGRNNRAALVTVAGGDDLVKEVGSLLVEGQVTQFVDDQGGGLGVDLEFADQGVIDLGSEQLVEHLHGGGEEHAHVGLAGAPAEDLRQEGFPHAGITDNDHIGALLEEVQVEQVEEAVFGLLAGFVMGEVELVEGRLRGEARELEAALDRAAVAGFQFQIGQTFQGGGEAKILRWPPPSSSSPVFGPWWSGEVGSVSRAGSSADSFRAFKMKAS